MFQEVVRPGTLSRVLTMQLLIGNAVEVLWLLQAGVTIDSAELEALRKAADSFRSGGSADLAVTSSAISDSSVEMVTAARTALVPDTTQALQATLSTLADALILIAETRGLSDVQIPVGEIVGQLSAIRQALAARGAVSTDDTHGLLTA